MKIRNEIKSILEIICNSDKKASASYSVADEIMKYKKLLDMGVITQEEFEAKKRQLMGL